MSTQSDSPGSSGWERSFFNFDLSFGRFGHTLYQLEGAQSCHHSILRREVLSNNFLVSLHKVDLYLVRLVSEPAGALLQALHECWPLSTELETIKLHFLSRASHLVASDLVSCEQGEPDPLLVVLPPHVACHSEHPEYHHHLACFLPTNTFQALLFKSTLWQSYCSTCCVLLIPSGPGLPLGAPWIWVWEAMKEQFKQIWPQDSSRYYSISTYPTMPPSGENLSLKVEGRGAWPCENM